MSEFAFDKEDWRHKNIAWMKEAYEFFPKNKMICSYMELMGTSGVISFEMMKKYFFHPNQFVALEQEPAVFMDNCVKKKNDGYGFQLIYGDAYQIAPLLATEYKPPVGIFNFDGMQLVGTENWWRDHKPALQAVVNKTIDVYGCCVLILNQSLDQPKGSIAERAERLRLNASKMFDCFGKWGVTSERLLGKRGYLADKCLDYSFLGQAGAFEIYKSKDHTTRMATSRFIFRKNFAKIESGIHPG